MTLLRLSAPLFAALALTAGASPAMACAACSCGDPTLTTVGLEKPFAGRLRLSTITQLRSESQGDKGVNELSSTEWRHDFAVSYAPFSRLVFALRAPVVHRRLQFVSERSQRSTGIGDVDVLARVIVWRDRNVMPRFLVSLQPGLTLPTSPLVRLNGMRADYDLQTGRGSWVPTVGANASYFGDGWSAFASVAGHLPLGERFAQKRGKTLLWTALSQWQPVDWLALQLGVDGRAATPNEAMDGDVFDTGGAMLFASTGVSFALLRDFLINTTVRVPVLSRLRGNQREGAAFSLSLSYDFET